MVHPLTKPNIVHKRTKKFFRHQSDMFLRIRNDKRKTATWRRPKGIDSRVRRRYRDNMKMVKIGYGTNAKHRHVLPNGFRKAGETEVPSAITFTGRLYGETDLLAVAHAYQQATGHHLKRPPMDKVTKENAGG